jgi:hypothetical protein
MYNFSRIQNFGHETSYFIYQLFLISEKELSVPLKTQILRRRKKKNPWKNLARLPTAVPFVTSCFPPGNVCVNT